jgi:DNA-binding response OmpR family regulator
MQILLVEDDPSLAEGLRVALLNAGYGVNHVTHGGAALDACRAEPPDLMILDLGLPDLDGLEVLRALRRREQKLPVLILSARSALDERVSGLDLGADDYLAKPFEIPELLARVRVLARRLGTAQTSLIQIGVVSLDTATREVQVAGRPVELARREYMLLRSLMENAGRVQTRERLEQQLYSWGEEVASNALEVHIHHLRKKLGADFITTVRGVGYSVRT